MTPKITDEQPVTWFSLPDGNNTLSAALLDFFNEMNEDRMLARIEEKYPGHSDDFARSVGYPAKTDSIDARVPAQMAEVIMNRHPERERFIRLIQDTQRQVLTAIVVRRQLMAVHVAERNRLPPSHLQGRKSIRVLS